MKKWIFSMIALVFALTVKAQQTGMHFEHNLSWEQVLAKAKAENKYIFIDCYTTWCGPCKQMSKNVFPMETVGAFFNKNFINIKVQLDTLKDKDGKILDNEEVKSWYANGDMLEAKYNVKAYPTYLFFDPSGTIVHRAVGSSEADKFVAKGKDALNPATQYYAMKRQYNAGKRDEKFLQTFAKAANDGYDKPFSDEVVNIYLATQKDLTTPENMLFIVGNIKSSKDIGFKELLAKPEAFDKVAGPGYARATIRQIILKEEIQAGSTAKQKASTEVPDFDLALQKAKTKYPDYAPEAIAYYKLNYYKNKSDWKNFGTAVSDYMTAYGSSATPEQMNNFAWTVFESCNDMACVANALEWSKQSFAANNSHMFMDTYANLLYKSGNKDEAIKWETKAMSLAKENKEDTGDYQATLDKMTKGEKTW